MRSIQDRLRLAALIFALVQACPGTSHASGTVVPDNYLTVQGAVDSTAADTIYVREGEYAEDVALHRDLVLVPYPRVYPSSASYDYPRIRSLHVTSNNGGSHIDAVSVLGIHFRGPVGFVNDVVSGSPFLTFEGCRMDAGFSAAPLNPSATFASVRLRGNVILGSVSIGSLYYPSIVENAIIGGGLTVSGNGTVRVLGNFIEGPGSVGLSICCSDAFPVAFDNVVRGFVTGIRASIGSTVAGNRVTNCSGNGIELTGGAHGFIVTVSGNIVRACGGFGIRTFNTGAQILLNTVDSTGQGGIRAEGASSEAFVRNNTVRVTGSYGIWAAGPGAVSSNVVLRAAANGIDTGTDAADSNVVGRCGGAGIVTSGSSVRHNTSYLNQGAGIVLTGPGTAVDHDIAFGNGAAGLDASGATSPVLGCNDWYSNTGGPTAGVSPGATDLSIDPQFCDVTGDNVLLAATSPVLAAPGCGLIGARGLGCTSPTSVQPAPAGVRAFSASPVPARSAVRLSWTPGTASTIEVFDLRGARRFHVDLPAGSSEYRWNAVDDSGLLVPSGIYFVRHTVTGGPVEATRVVIHR